MTPRWKETITAPTGTSPSDAATPASSNAISMWWTWNGWRESVSGRSNGENSTSQPSWRPIHLRSYRRAKLRQEPGRPVEIVEADHFNRAVHVTIGNADQSDSHAFAAQLHRVGVGAGRPRCAANLHRNFDGFRRLLQSLQYARVDV